MASQLGHNDAVSNKVDGEKDTRSDLHACAMAVCLHMHTWRFLRVPKDSALRPGGYSGCRLLGSFVTFPGSCRHVLFNGWGTA